MLKKIYTFLFVRDLLGSQPISAPVSPEPLKKKLMRDFTRLTLLSYILLILNPVMPLIANKMAHTFWLEYHLITVHGVYGKAHVDTELSKSMQQTDKDKSSNSSKAGQDDFSHLAPITVSQFSTASSAVRSFTPYLVNIPTTYHFIDPRPPKV